MTVRTGSWVVKEIHLQTLWIKFKLSLYIKDSSVSCEKKTLQKHAYIYIVSFFRMSQKNSWRKLGTIDQSPSSFPAPRGKKEAVNHLNWETIDRWIDDRPFFGNNGRSTPPRCRHHMWLDVKNISNVVYVHIYVYIYIGIIIDIYIYVYHISYIKYQISYIIYHI